MQWIFYFFTSDGPSSIYSKILPTINSNILPHVNFIRTKEKREQIKNFKNLYSISSDDAFKQLNVLYNCNELFINKGINIDNFKSKKEKIKEYNAIVEKSVIITLDKNINVLNERKSGNLYK